MSLLARQVTGASSGFLFLNRLLFGFLLLMVLMNLAVVGLVIATGYTGYWLLLAPLLVIVNSIFIGRVFLKVLQACGRIYRALRDATRGNFSGRITNLKTMGEIGKIGWEVNDLLDIVESYFKGGLLLSQCGQQQLSAQSSASRYAGRSENLADPHQRIDRSDEKVGKADRHKRAALLAALNQHQQPDRQPEGCSG